MIHLQLKPKVLVQVLDWTHLKSVEKKFYSQDLFINQIDIIKIIKNAITYTLFIGATLLAIYTLKPFQITDQMSLSKCLSE